MQNIVDTNQQACNCQLKKKRKIFIGTMEVWSEAAETPRDMIPTMVPQKMFNSIQFNLFMLRFIMLLGALFSNIVHC